MTLQEKFDLYKKETGNTEINIHDFEYWELEKLLSGEF